MKVDFQLIDEDYIEFNTHHMSFSKTVKRSIFIQRYIVPLVFLIAPFAFSEITQIPFILWMVCFGLTYILWAIFYPLRIKKSIKRRIKKMLKEGNNSDFLGQQILELTDEGIEKKNLSGERKNSWASVQRVEESENLILIYISSISAYMIPKKAFENDEKKNEFIQKINRMKGE